MDIRDKHKDLIVSLLIQDMRHNQLILKLQEAGLDIDMHFLEIIEVVAELMDIPEASDQWADTYISFLEQAPKYEITGKGDALKPLAEECYKTLLACKEIETRLASRN